MEIKKVLVMSIKRTGNFKHMKKNFYETLSRLVDEYYNNEDGCYYANIRNSLSGIKDNNQLKILFLKNMCASIKYGRIDVVNNIAELSTKIYDRKIRRDILRAAAEMLGSKDIKSGADWANRLAADYSKGNYQDRIVAMALREDARRMKREDRASMERARIYCERIEKILTDDARFEQLKLKKNNYIISP